VLRNHEIPVLLNLKSKVNKLLLAYLCGFFGGCSSRWLFGCSLVKSTRWWLLRPSSFGSINLPLTLGYTTYWSFSFFHVLISLLVLINLILGSLFHHLYKFIFILITADIQILGFRWRLLLFFPGVLIDILRLLVPWKLSVWLSVAWLVNFIEELIVVLFVQLFDVFAGDRRTIHIDSKSYTFDFFGWGCLLLLLRFYTVLFVEIYCESLSALFLLPLLSGLVGGRRVLLLLGLRDWLCFY